MFRTWWGAAVLLWFPAAHGYETDQVTDRGQPLADVRVPANDRMDVLLDDAVDRANRKTGCDASDARTKKVLARRIFRATSRDRWVWSRGAFRAPGFSVYSKWMETAEIDRREFGDRRDLYGSLTFWDSAVLHLAGPCSTFLVGGVLIGSDKMDHFLDEGFAYLRKSRWGEEPARAVRYGTRTERSIYGMLTSKAFSYADLRANYDGYRFYAELLEAGSPLQRGEDGCVQRVQPFDWSDWVTWHWDEALNPPVYARRAGIGVLRHLEAEADRYCADLPRWAPDGYARLLANHGPEQDPAWVQGAAPSQGDPYQLDAVCAGIATTPTQATRRKEAKGQ